MDSTKVAEYLNSLGTPDKHKELMEIQELLLRMDSPVFVLIDIFNSKYKSNRRHSVQTLPQ